MHYGLFGKLPSRRDFISQNAPRSFLRLWEPWLEQGMTDSRRLLGGASWEDHFRAAPIWRFWLGAEICGESILGAFMPSMDAVGRYFPLTLVCMADEGKVLTPPSIDPQHGWFDALENILLSALDPEASPEALMAELAGVTPVRTVTPPTTFAPLQPERPSLSLTDLFATCRLAYHDCRIASATLWWTVGGEDFKPTAFMRKDFPETSLFAGMLTGQFTQPAQEKIEFDKTAIGVKPS